MKIHPVGAELFHVVKWTDRQTDRRRELTVAFRDFGERAFKKIRFVMSCNQTTQMDFSVVKTRLELNNNGDCSLSTTVFFFYFWVN